MHRIFAAVVLIAGVLLCSASALGQQQSYIFGEYYVCDQNREAMADVLVEHVIGPIYQRHVDSGELTGWGWLSHHAGSRWRRVLFFTGNDLEKLLAARDKIIAAYETDITEEGREFVSICGEHDDLIWQQAAGADLAASLGNLGTVTYSTYYECDVARQERADEIVNQLIGPEMEKLREAGELATWSWHSHVIGGRYRRLMTHSGSSHAALIAAVNKYNEAAAQKNEAMATEFSQICNAHQDYLWNRVLPAPPDGN